MNIKLNLKNNMAENKKYNSILVSGRKDETLTYSRYIKDEESGKSVKESLDEKISTTDKIEINQIAQAVWDKLKNEYLRLDGNNSMGSDLKMGGNSIKDASEISSDNDSPVFISLLNNEVTIGANDDEDNGVPVGRWATIWRDSTFYRDVEAAGFKTHDRTNIGLLVNDGSVGLAITDSDIDGLFQQVFQTVIG
nr:hypothetical protein [uncultured Prevotella sp.]